MPQLQINEKPRVRQYIISDPSNIYYTIIIQLLLYNKHIRQSLHPQKGHTGRQFHCPKTRTDEICQAYLPGDHMAPITG